MGFNLKTSLENLSAKNEAFLIRQVFNVNCFQGLTVGLAKRQQQKLPGEAAMFILSAGLD